MTIWKLQEHTEDEFQESSDGFICSHIKSVHNYSLHKTKLNLGWQADLLAVEYDDDDGTRVLYMENINKQ